MYDTIHNFLSDTKTAIILAVAAKYFFCLWDIIEYRIKHVYFSKTNVKHFLKVIYD